MAKRVQDRYASMADMAAALGEYLQAAPRTTTVQTEATPDGIPAPDDLPAEESYGLTEAVAGLSQLLGEVPSSPSLTGQSADRSYVIPTVEDGASAATEAAPPATAPASGVSRSRRFLPPWVWLAACGAAAAMLGIVFLVSTRFGLVKIELSDPAAKVEVKVDGEAISLAGLDRPIRFRVGEHGIVVTGEDYETVTQTFTVKRGMEDTLKVTLVPKAGQAPPRRPPNATPTPRKTVYTDWPRTSPRHRPLRRCQG